MDYMNEGFSIIFRSDLVIAMNQEQFFVLDTWIFSICQFKCLNKKVYASQKDIKFALINFARNNGKAMKS